MSIKMNRQGEIVGGTHANPTQILHAIARKVFGEDAQGVITIPEAHEPLPPDDPLPPDEPEGGE